MLVAPWPWKIARRIYPNDERINRKGARQGVQTWCYLRRGQLSHVEQERHWHLAVEPNCKGCCQCCQCHVWGVSLLLVYWEAELTFDSLALERTKQVWPDALGPLWLGAAYFAFGRTSCKWNCLQGDKKFEGPHPTNVSSNAQGR